MPEVLSVVVCKNKAKHHAVIWNAEIWFRLILKYTTKGYSFFIRCYTSAFNVAGCYEQEEAATKKGQWKVTSQW
jgi:hypothetical protein